MKRAARLHITFLFLTLLLLSVSCSSAPKNSGDVYQLRKSAEKEMDLGNREAGRGNFEIALGFLNECKRRAVLVDDLSLMIRSGLSLGNALFSAGRRDEAFEEWEQAIALAEKLGDSELLSAARIFRARGRLVSSREAAQAVLDEVNREAANIKSSKLFIAFSWQVKGLALRELRSYNEAEAALRRSLDIHEKERYLENASYDWYVIASIRSLAGNTSGALQALEASIALDRRIENTWGLASSWRAVGDVHRKAGNSGEAAQAYQRARAIFSAMGNEQEAAEIDKRMGN